MKYFEAGLFINLYDQAGSNTVRLTNENALYKNVQTLKDDFIKIQEIKVEFFLLLLILMVALYLLFALLFFVNTCIIRLKKHLRTEETLASVVYHSPVKMLASSSKSFRKRSPCY